MLEEPNDELPLTGLEQPPEQSPVVGCVNLAVAAALGVVVCEMEAATVGDLVGVDAPVIVAALGVVVCEMEAATVGDLVGVDAPVITTPFRILVREVEATPVGDLVGLEATARRFVGCNVALRSTVIFGLTVSGWSGIFTGLSHIDGLVGLIRPGIRVPWRTQLMEPSAWPQ